MTIVPLQKSVAEKDHHQPKRHIVNPGTHKQGFGKGNWGTDTDKVEDALAEVRAEGVEAADRAHSHQMTDTKVKTVPAEEFKRLKKGGETEAEKK